MILTKIIGLAIFANVLYLPIVNKVALWQANQFMRIIKWKFCMLIYQFLIMYEGSQIPTSI